MAAEPNPFSSAIATGGGALSLTSVTDAESLLGAAGAGDVLGLLQRLGFWVGSGRRADHPTRTFDPNLSRLTGPQLADTFGYWQSELSRLIALCGALEGAESRARHELKAARSREAARILREIADDAGKVPTKATLDVLVGEHSGVIAIERNLGVLDSVSIALRAAREAIDGYCRVLSRELTRRGDAMRAGVG